MRRPWLAAGAMCLLGGSDPARQEPECRFDFRAQRQGVRIEPLPGVVNYFAGGDVRARCLNNTVRIRADSVASYGETVTQFIGRVRYEDSASVMTSNFGTYFRESDRFEARGSVVYTDTQSHSTLTGPSLDYYRSLPGRRPFSEMYADQRPTIEAHPSDTTEANPEPYVIVGDRVRIRGQDQFWAGGRVTVDRSDLRGRGDSLFFDTGEGNSGLLLGRAAIRRIARDSFSLDADRIDLTLEHRDVRGVYAQVEAHLVAEDIDLSADSLRLALAERHVEHIEAWGDSTRALAVSPDYRVLSDSLAIDSPGQRLREVRAYGKAWAGLLSDSATSETDWILGDTLLMRFGTPRPAPGIAPDTAVPPKLQYLRAAVQAAALFRVRDAVNGGRSINYTRADTIVVTMKDTADSVAVDHVRAVGNVDGLQLQPAPPRTRGDTAADTSARRRPRPGSPR